MGSDHERVVCRLLRETGNWHAQRAAASGGGTAANLPDLTFGRDGVGFAAEEKSGQPPLYVREEEVKALKSYARAYGMQPLLIARYTGERVFYLYDVPTPPRTDDGSLKLSPDLDAGAMRVAHPDGDGEGVSPDRLDVASTGTDRYSRLVARTEGTDE